MGWLLWEVSDMTLTDEIVASLEVVGESEVDARGRLALGRAGARPGRRYQVRSEIGRAHV